MKEEEISFKLHRGQARSFINGSNAISLDAFDWAVAALKRFAFELSTTAFNLVFASLFLLLAFLPKSHQPHSR